MEETKYITVLAFAQSVGMSPRTVYRMFKKIGHARTHDLMSPEEQMEVKEKFKKHALEKMESRNRGMKKVITAKEKAANEICGAIWHGMAQFGALGFENCTGLLSQDF